MSKTTTTQVMATVTEKFSKPKQSESGKWFYTMQIPEEGWALGGPFATYDEACADIVKYVFAYGGTRMSVTYQVVE